MWCYQRTFWIQEKPLKRTGWSQEKVECLRIRTEAETITNGSIKTRCRSIKTGC